MTTTLGVRRPVEPTDYRAWSLAWLGGPVIGIANGVIRRAVYEEPLGDLAAHQVATLTAVGLFGSYIYLLDRRRPIATGRDAMLIGGGWLAATAAFEFGFGHYVAGASWSTLLRDWDITQGRIWGLTLLTLAVAPAAVRAVRLRRTGRSTRR
jgi:hypothetical protein